MLPFPAPGDLPNPGIEHISLPFPVLAGRFFATELLGIPCGQILQDKHNSKGREEPSPAQIKDKENTYFSILEVKDFPNHPCTEKLLGG